MKYGIIFYSRTGNTRHVARIIEKNLKGKNAGVDLIEIEHLKKPGFLKAGRYAITEIDMPIKNSEFDLNKYDFLVFGSPVWAGRPAPYIKTFMNKAENIKGKKAAIFNTGEGSTDDRQRIIEMMNNNLENLGLSTIGSSLSLKMKKQEIQDGKQHINSFIDRIISK